MRKSCKNLLVMYDDMNTIDKILVENGYLMDCQETEERGWAKYYYEDRIYMIYVENGEIDDIIDSKCTLEDMRELAMLSAEKRKVD